MPRRAPMLLAVGTTVFWASCSLLFTETGKDGELSGADAAGNGPLADAARLDDGARAPDASPGDATTATDASSIVTLTLVVSAGEGSGQVTLTNQGGLFCPSSMSPCTFNLPRFDPVTLFASPPDRFLGWQHDVCPHSENQNSAQMTMTTDCTVTGLFSPTAR